MKYFGVLFISIMLFVGCDMPSNSPASIKNSSISRNFEDLTLGMSEEQLKSQFSCRPLKEIPEISVRTYLVYTKEHYLKEYMCSNFDEGRSKNLEDIYMIQCSFFEGNLYAIYITYSNYYKPGWDNFIYKTTQKYGSGEKLSDGIQWYDKETTLIIEKEDGEQWQNYGEHYLVTYADNLLYSKQDKRSKEKSPNF